MITTASVYLLASVYISTSNPKPTLTHRYYTTLHQCTESVNKLNAQIKVGTHRTFCMKVKQVKPVT